MKFYERTLDSFSDGIITRAIKPSGPNGCWYAVLDTGPELRLVPDFSTGASTEELARSLCAKKLRNDAKGIGKYAPHAIMRPGYDFHWKLCKHWAGKEAFGGIANQKHTRTSD